MRFKDLIENNGLNKLVFKDTDLRQPKKEEASQLLFYGIADAYCEANDLDLSPEADPGRGPVDFKISGGYSTKVLVEVKLSTNSKLQHGLTVQLEQYKKSERTDRAILLVIMTANNEEKIKNLEDLAKSQRDAGFSVPEIIVADARPKPSASRI